MTYNEEIIASMVEYEDKLVFKMPPQKTFEIKITINGIEQAVFSDSYFEEDQTRGSQPVNRKSRAT